jgi:hypothetical protein
MDLSLSSVRSESKVNTKKQREPEALDWSRMTPMHPRHQSTYTTFLYFTNNKYFDQCWNIEKAYVALKFCFLHQLIERRVLVLNQSDVSTYLVFLDQSSTKHNLLLKFLLHKNSICFSYVLT